MKDLPRIRPAGWRDLGPRLVWIGLAAGLLLRAAAWAILGDKLPVHGFESGVISDNLAAGRGYWMPFYFSDVPVRSFIPPLYPILMALFKMATPHWVAGLRVLQVAASLLNAVLAADLAGRWFGRRVMRWTFLAVLAYPVFVVYCLSIFSTTFIMSFVLALMGLMDRFRELPSLRLGLLTGAVHALAILTSPPLALLGVLFLFRLWRNPDPGRWRRTLVYLLTLGVVWSPWVIRNAVVHRDILLTSTNGGFNFLVGNNPLAGGYTWGDLREDTFWQVVDPEALRRLPEPRLEYWFYGRALSYVREEPGRYLALFFKKVYYFWWCQDVARFGYPGAWSRAYQALYGFLLPFAAAGALFWRRRWRRLFPVYFLLAEYTLLYGAYFVRSRFRWEIEPLLLLFAVVGWFDITRRLRGRGVEESP
ncbi:MAG: glycosyltransferase family 39 protein [Candidatus Krumholzibacteriota bacterium]|nr:glycosyltransferase family 39 protein [Candidatus Krumholzibacteriota bacterium]